jgi:hypothetical protein
MGGLFWDRAAFSGFVPADFPVVEFLATSGTRGRAVVPTAVVTPFFAAGLTVFAGDDGVDVEAVVLVAVAGGVSTPAAVLGC